MTSPSYAIPKPLWDAMENVLMAKSRELIKDIAASLRQSEKPLLEAFKARKHTFHLLDVSDPTNDTFQCNRLVSTHGVAHRCRKPVLLGQQVCPEHEFTALSTVQGKPEVRRLVTEDGTTYFVDTLCNVYTIDFDRVGTYHDNRVILYEIDEEEEYA